MYQFTAHINLSRWDLPLGTNPDLLSPVSTGNKNLLLSGFAESANNKDCVQNSGNWTTQWEATLAALVLRNETYWTRFVMYFSLVLRHIF